MKEGEMYAKVKDFFVNIKGCNDSFTWYANAEGAKSGRNIIIDFGGGQIKPDVYGIKTFQDRLSIFLAEGKTSIGGHRYDEARGQALVNQRFCHFSYLFFPESEFRKREMVIIKCECEEYGLGLLKVPTEKKMNDKDIIVKSKVSPRIRPDDEFLRTSSKLVSQIKESLAGGKFKDVYPNLIRDFLYLIKENKFLKESVLEKFIVELDKLEKSEGIKVLDPYRRKVLKENREEQGRRLAEDIFDTSLLLELIRKTDENYELTDHGHLLKGMIKKFDEENLFKRDVFEGIKNYMAARLISIYSFEINEILKKIIEIGKPIPWGRVWCKDCSTMDWNLKKFWDDANKKYVCPNCGSYNLVENLYMKLDPTHEGRFEGFYPVEKFLDTVGIIKRWTYKEAKSKFYDIESPPNPSKAGRLYYIWIGDFFSKDKK